MLPEWGSHSLAPCSHGRYQLLHLWLCCCRGVPHLEGDMLGCPRQHSASWLQWQDAESQSPGVERALRLPALPPRTCRTATRNQTCCCVPCPEVLRCSPIKTIGGFSLHQKRRCLQDLDLGNRFHWVPPKGQRSSEGLRCAQHATGWDDHARKLRICVWNLSCSESLRDQCQWQSAS